MKKLVSILAIVLAFTMMMSVTSFAAASFEIKADAEYTGATVTPAADSIEVVADTTAGNYYGVLLVAGNALPTVDTDILYINQVTADAETETIDVLPILPAANTDVTLYVSSNVSGAELITVPMTYAEEAVVPTKDYITTADTNKGTIKEDVAASKASANAGELKDKVIASLALNAEAYPSTGYIVKAVAADGSAIDGATVYYSTERAKYVALIPVAAADYKFEVIAAGTEGAVANAIIAKYGNMNEDANGTINAPDFAQFKKVFLGDTIEAKKVLIADVSGDGKVNAPDFAQFKKAFLGSEYTFAVTTK